MRVDLPGTRQLGLAKYAARVNQHAARGKAHPQPGRAIIAAVLAIIAGHGRH